MRIWTLVFLSACGLGATLAFGDAQLLTLLARAVFLVVVLVALLVGMRGVALQMAEVEARLPARGRLGASRVDRPRRRAAAATQGGPGLRDAR